MKLKNWDASLIWKSILGVICCTCKKAPNIKVIELLEEAWASTPLC